MSPCTELRRSGAWVVALIAALLLAIVSSAAHAQRSPDSDDPDDAGESPASPPAQPTAADLALARGYFEKAKEARNKGDFEAAAAMYLQAYRASKETLKGLLFNIGVMHWRLAEQAAQAGDEERASDARSDAALYFRGFVRAAPGHVSVAEAERYLAEHEKLEQAAEARRAEAEKRAAESRRLFLAGEAEWRRAAGHDQRGEADAAGQARERAVASFRQSIELVPDAPHAAEVDKYINQYGQLLEQGGVARGAPEPMPVRAPEPPPVADVGGPGVWARFREHGRFTFDTAVCQNVFGDKDASLGAVCGVSFAVGAGYAVHPWVELRIGGLVGSTPGAYLGVDIRPLRARIRPVAALGVPVFFSAGVRPGARLAAGAEVAVTHGVSASLLFAFERYFSPEPGTPDMDLVPILGLAARL